MRHQRIRRALERRAFQPFEARTSWGERYRIPHPDAAWVTPGGNYLIVAMEDDSATLVDMEFVVELTSGGGRD